MFWVDTFYLASWTLRARSSSLLQGSERLFSGKSLRFIVGIEERQRAGDMAPPAATIQAANHHSVPVSGVDPKPFESSREDERSALPFFCLKGFWTFDNCPANLTLASFLPASGASLPIWAEVPKYRLRSQNHSYNSQHRKARRQHIRRPPSNDKGTPSTKQLSTKQLHMGPFLGGSHAHLGYQGPGPAWLSAALLLPKRPK